MNRALTIVLVSLACASCVSVPSDKAVLVEEVEIGAVKDCTALGEVKGRSGWGGSVKSTGDNNSTVAAKEKAAALGATHIVWIAGSTNGWGAVKVARAYRC